MNSDAGDGPKPDELRRQIAKEALKLQYLFKGIGVALCVVDAAMRPESELRTIAGQEPPAPLNAAVGGKVAAGTPKEHDVRMLSGDDA